MATVSKQKKVKNVRQKLKLFRANEPLKSVLMWGINYSFSALNHVKPRAMLLKDDFKAYLKVKVNNHLFNKEYMPSRFKFKEYCPMVFKNLRDRFGVNIFDYWDSFTGNQPLWDSARGKSGSKFLVTYNRQFVAKTISSEEVEQMHHMLEEYYSYIVHCHGHTLLPQYLGLYRLTVNDQETYILVMRNVFSPRLPVHWKYDLKPFLSHPCSRNKSRQKSIGRHQSLHSNRLQLNMTSEVKLPKSGARLSYQHSLCDSKPLPTLKDNDFLNDVSKLYIGNDAKVKLMDLLEADVQFLQENNLMDYSLLIGIHEVGLPSEPVESIDDIGGPVPIDQNGPPEDRIISAGDGLGSISSHWHLRRVSASRRSIVDQGILYGSQLGGNLSTGDDEEDDGGILSDPGISTAFPGNNTPPDSPTEVTLVDQAFSGELHPHMECYGIKSSSDSPKQLIYFIAIIDILTRYGMRKRTAQTYKSVKYGTSTDVCTVKPEAYGRRLLDFISQCVV